MTTPPRGLLYHFTHMSNLASIARSGLHCDSNVMDRGLAFIEVGDQDIKTTRRTRSVPVPPGGVVADYVPFYFAPRSPMLFSMYMGNVPTFSGRQDEVVYLVTSIARVQKHSMPVVFTDRNATVSGAQYGTDPANIGDYVDWELMEATWWHNTLEEPDRKQKRMAELLVYSHVPWTLIIGVVAKTEERAWEASGVLANVGVETRVTTRRDWYF